MSGTTPPGTSWSRRGPPHQFGLARETALEGLAYIRAARTAMGIDPGPELPPLAAAQGAGRSPRSARSTCRGRRSGPARSPASETPYYYPGGRYQGRPVPAGWYSTPWWKTALGAGAGVLGGMLIADALFSPAFADPGYGYDAGYQEGFGTAPTSATATAAATTATGGGGDQSPETTAAVSSTGDFGGGGYAGDFRRWRRLRRRRLRRAATSRGLRGGGDW